MLRVTLLSLGLGLAAMALAACDQGYSEMRCVYDDATGAQASYEIHANPYTSDAFYLNPEGNPVLVSPGGEAKVFPVDKEKNETCNVSG